MLQFFGLLKCVNVLNIVCRRVNVGVSPEVVLVTTVARKGFSTLGTIVGSFMIVITQ